MSRVKLADVVEKIQDFVDKDKTDLLYYVGGEHFDNGSVTVNKKSLIKGSTIGPAFHMKFKSGDVLLMSRNPHLRKAGVVNFDGICSNVSYVLRTKNDKVLLQSLIPFLLQSDAFWNFAEKNKKGSTNFFLNWSDFGKFEFELPSLDVQKKACELLRSINKNITNSIDLIKKSERLIESRFIQMFSIYSANHTIGDVATICRGASPRPIANFITTNKDGENWVKIGDATENDIYITHTKEKINKDGADKSRRVKPGDFILSNSMSFGRPYIMGISGCVHDGWLIISDYQKTFEPLFLYYLLRSEGVQNQFNGTASGSTVKNLNSNIVRNVKVITPPLKLQKEFIDFSESINKSKTTLSSKIIFLEKILKKIFERLLKGDDK